MIVTVLFAILRQAIHKLTDSRISLYSVQQTIMIIFQKINQLM